ncbi:MAG TPA: DNA methyltransferase [Ktedonobacteraceae bacterium]|nr:DNA methyltransferase [Ktedonobacteraceae bacterium]
MTDRQPITMNTLYYGDNLKILREYIPTESIDLIYLDPPFNSNRNYNVLFKDESGTDSEAQITAFEDTWHWNQSAEDTFQELITQAPANVSSMVDSLHGFIGNNQMMAYLVMMTARLVELHRVLKPTGSLYLHCDSTASHYLKIILDTIFGLKNFRNEIVWKRFNFHADAKRFGKITDRVLFYTKTEDFTFNRLRVPFSDKYQESKFTHIDKDGRRFRLDNLNPPGGRGPIYEFNGVTKPWRFTEEHMKQLHAEGRIYTESHIAQLKRYLDELDGQAVSELWSDIDPINPMSNERLGYPTQKPLTLLERIINASSNPGDIVLDSFCGCGTAIAAAQKLGRKWIGIDITHLSIALQKYRLQEMFPDIQFKVVGEPHDVGAAKQLAQDDRYQFQWWALSLVRAKPLGGQEDSKTGKKGSDKGIDGVITFIDDAYSKSKRVLVQVKSGHVKSGDVRDLVGTVQRENAAIGVFITLEEPTRDMKTEAVSAGHYESPGWNQRYPRIQILTIAELLRGAKIDMPPQFGTFKQAQKVKQNGAGQEELF